MTDIKTYCYFNNMTDSNANTSINSPLMMCQSSNYARIDQKALQSESGIESTPPYTPSDKNILERMVIALQLTRSIH